MKKKAINVTKFLKKDMGYDQLGPGKIRIYELVKMKLREIPVEDANGAVSIQPDFICPRIQEVPKEYVIYDYTSDKVGNTDKELVQIVYYKRTRFNKEGQEIPVPEPVYFRREENGQIRCTASNTELDAHLFFSPYNEANAGKPGYTRPKEGYLFRLLDTNKKAEDLFDSEKKVAKAITLIDEWDEDTTYQVSEGLLARQEISLPGKATVGEIKSELARLARKNPNRILTIDKDESIKVFAKYREAARNGVLQTDGLRILWSDGGTLCNIPSGISPEEAFKSHVLDYKHKEVYERVQELCKQKAVPA